jgi:hypothetical protein
VYHNFKRNLAALGRLLDRGGPSAVLQLVCSLVICAIVLIIVSITGPTSFVEVMALSISAFVLLGGLALACYRPLQQGHPLPVHWRRGAAALWQNLLYNSRWCWWGYTGGITGS